ncbi:hypothetical protein ACFL96_14990 [Thermoproteota archaeon]
MVKIQRLPNGQLVITIPKRLAELKKWDKGTEIIFEDHTKNSYIITTRKKAKKHANKEDE